MTWISINLILELRHYEFVVLHGDSTENLLHVNAQLEKKMRVRYDVFALNEQRSMQ